MGTKGNRGLCVGLTGVMLVVMAAAAAAEEESAHDLVKRMLESTAKIPVTARVKLSSDRGWVRELTMSGKPLNGADASYMEVTAPMDMKDTRFLLLDRATGRDEQFIYVPAAKRAMQVSTETRKQPFLGSDFYIYDMVRPDLEGFNYAFVGEEDVGGHHCKLIQSTPKEPAGELYSKTITAMDVQDAVVLRTQFFDPQGKPLKVWTITKLEKVDGHWTPLDQTMVNQQENHQSRLELIDVKYDADIPDETFSRMHLTR
jgi:outer membrane lipoprotein-sorting protein